MGKMDELLEPFTEIELNDVEYGHLLEDTYHGSQTFRISVPKVTPQAGKPNSVRVNVPGRIIVNDPSCKPNVTGSLTSKNFLVVPRLPDRSFRDLADPRQLLLEGTKFQVMCMNKDPRELWLNSTIG